MSATIDHHKERIRDAGYKLTRARITVLQAILDLGGHVTSSAVLDTVSEMDDNIGRASVFRSLELFTQLGIIRPTYIETSQTPVYVMMPGGHHHHIICTSCNHVIEFDDCGLTRLESELQSRYGVQITGHLLEFYALCADCVPRD